MFESVFSDLFTLPLFSSSFLACVSVLVSSWYSRLNDQKPTTISSIYRPTYPENGPIESLS